jgi:hypothetical protein
MASFGNDSDLNLEKEAMMNSNFDGMNGMYGSVQFVALSELGHLWNKAGRRQADLPWKRVVLTLAVMATPVALLLTGGLGS